MAEPARTLPLAPAARRESRGPNARIKPTAKLPRLGSNDEPRDHFISIPASWADYVRHVRMRGERRFPRLTFTGDSLELMSPSENHEEIGQLLNSLVLVFCEERNIDCKAIGSTTQAQKALGKAAEPDQSYRFGNRASNTGTAPDLAIEVVWTSGAVDKLPLYLALGVREVWIWQRGAITVHVRSETRSRARYMKRRTSTVLRGIDFAAVAAAMLEPTTTAAVRRFRAHCRSQR